MRYLLRVLPVAALFYLLMPVSAAASVPPVASAQAPSARSVCQLSWRRNKALGAICYVVRIGSSALDVAGKVAGAKQLLDAGREYWSGTKAAPPSPVTRCRCHVRRDTRKARPAVGCRPRGGRRVMHPGAQ